MSETTMKECSSSKASTWPHMYGRGSGQDNSAVMSITHLLVSRYSAKLLPLAETHISLVYGIGQKLPQANIQTLM